jgi:thiol-disulfide isomerase/thioredoxin
MNKTIQTVVMAALCLIFKAEAQDNKAVDVTTKGIQIGQKVPDIVLNNLHNYKDAKGKPVTTLKLSGLNEKLIILDFWATWCSPCVAMIPKMEALQTQFKGEILILPVTYQTKDVALPFLKKLKNGAPLLLPQVTDDKELNRLFPHVYLPHYVWIDYTGTVRAITGPEEVTAENIDKVLDNPIGKFALQQKKDVKIAYDNSKPLLINNNGGDGSNLVYHSVVTRYIEGLGSGLQNMKNHPVYGKRITFRNYDLRSIYAYAYGERKVWYGKNRVKLNVADTSKLEYDLKDPNTWQRLNTYCYELVLPFYAGEQMFRFLKEDLKRVFPQYDAKVVKMKTRCATLKVVGNTDLLKVRDTSSKKSSFSGLGIVLRETPLNTLIKQLNSVYMQYSQYPVIDLTNISEPVNLNITANLSNLDSINESLIKYGLRFQLEEHEIDVLEITDSTN